MGSRGGDHIESLKQDTSTQWKVGAKASGLLNQVHTWFMSTLKKNLERCSNDVVFG